MFFSIKHSYIFGKALDIVMQNENGPCPLIAIVNVLLLRRRVFIPMNEISLDELVQVKIKTIRILKVLDLSSYLDCSQCDLFRKKRVFNRRVRRPTVRSIGNASIS
jgi:hypothetical protein